ncbi:MAG: hypothetical protein ABFS32_19610 [Bacteroidota bacterium]
MYANPLIKDHQNNKVDSLTSVQNNSKARYFIGFSRNQQGIIEEKWLTEEQIQIKQLRNYISKASLAGIGLFGGKYSIEIYNKLQDWYLKQSPHSRRGFIKNLMGGMLIGAGLSACNDTLDEPIPETFEILGPSEVTMGKMGCAVIGSYTYQGNVKLNNPSWRLITPSSLQPFVRYDGEQEIECNFSIPGNLKLTIYPDSLSNQLLASKTVKVNQPEVGNKDYELPLLLLVRETRVDSYQNRFTGIYTYDIESKQITKLFSSKKLYDDGITWSPTGEKIAFSWGPLANPYDGYPTRIATYDLLSGEFRIISKNPTGIAWKVAWSPKDDWIAFADDSQALTKFADGTIKKHGYDEIKLIRPDGSEEFYLRGEGDENHILENGSKFSGFALSWDPSGTKIVGSGSKYSKHRLQIFENLFESQSSEIHLPTDEQLTNLYYSNNFGNISIDQFLYAVHGANGVAWSPNGDYLAYTLQFGWDPGYNTIAISRIDGTGSIQILDSRSGNTDYEWIELLLSPSWSPDGKKIYYTGMDVFEYNLYEIDVTVNNPVPQKIDLPLLNTKQVRFYG